MFTTLYNFCITVRDVNTLITVRDVTPVKTGVELMTDSDQDHALTPELLKTL